jgi:hypothetical protein
MAAPFPRLIPAHVGGRSLLRKALLCPPKRRKQPERYTPLIPNISESLGAAASVPPQKIVKNWLTKNIVK